MRRECNSKIKHDAVKHKNLTFLHRTVLLEEGLIVSTVISTVIFLLEIPRSILNYWSLSGYSYSLL